VLVVIKSKRTSQIAVVTGSTQASRHFRNKKKEYLKYGINELSMSRKKKNIRDLFTGINEFKKEYQPRSNLVKDENGDIAFKFLHHFK
jgi:hypothetical protein